MAITVYMHKSFPLTFIYPFLFHTIQCLWGSVKASRSLVILFPAGSPCIHRCKFLIPTIHALSLPAKVVSHSKITPLITLGSQLKNFCIVVPRAHQQIINMNTILQWWFSGATTPCICCMISDWNAKRLRAHHLFTNTFANNCEKYNNFILHFVFSL